LALFIHATHFLRNEPHFFSCFQLLAAIGHITNIIITHTVHKH